MRFLCTEFPPSPYCVPKGVRTFVPTDICSNTIFDRAGHSCSHQMTTPDIRAHIKLQPRTFVHTTIQFSNVK